jgi:hypothetical protein
MIFIAIILIVIGGILLVQTRAVILPSGITFTSNNGVKFRAKVKIWLERYKSITKTEIIQANNKINVEMAAALSTLHSNDMYSESVRRMAFIRKNTIFKINSLLRYSNIKNIDVIEISRNYPDAPSTSKRSSSGVKGTKNTGVILNK